MTLSNMTFSPKKIIREIKRNPQGITQQSVLEKTVEGYIYAVRNTKNNQPLDGSRVLKWYPTNKPFGLRNSIAQFLINS